jgi:hypothetical protein
VSEGTTQPEVKHDCNEHSQGKAYSGGFVVPVRVSWFKQLMLLALIVCVAATYASGGTHAYRKRLMQLHPTRHVFAESPYNDNMGKVEVLTFHSPPSLVSAKLGGTAMSHSVRSFFTFQYTRVENVTVLFLTYPSYLVKNLHGATCEVVIPIREVKKANPKHHRPRGCRRKVNRVGMLTHGNRESCWSDRKSSVGANLIAGPYHRA